MSRGPTLPGSRATVTYRDVEDRRVTIDRDLVQQQILAALRHGPLQKWQLRERLHVPEPVVYDELQVLRAAGQVKAVGKRYTDRKWALASWTPPPPVTTVSYDAVKPFVAPKPTPVTTSWWLDAPRTQWQTTVAQRWRG